MLSANSRSVKHVSIVISRSVHLLGRMLVQVLMEDTTVSDLQKAAEWEDVAVYLESITEQQLDVYVPLHKS